MTSELALRADLAGWDQSRSVPARAVALSVLLTLLVGAGILSLNFVVADGSIVRSDGLVYFMYARSIVLDGDTDLTQDYEDLDKLLDADALITHSVHRYAEVSPETGRTVFPWPAGSGVIMAPFYAIGYGIEVTVSQIQGRAPNSYGVIPQFAYGMGSILFGLLGFWTTFAVCREIAGTVLAYVSSVTAVVAGPLVFYIFFSPSMAHASSFGLVGVGTWLWWRLWRQPVSDYVGNWRSFVSLALLTGVLATVRYQNVLFAIPFVVLVVRGFSSIPLGRYARLLAVTAVVASLPVLLEAWHHVVNHGTAFGAWEGDAAHFTAFSINFGSPHFLEVFFSCDKGGFYWTPVLGLACAGLIWAAFTGSGWAAVMLSVVLANGYLIGGIEDQNGVFRMNASFGMRYLSECTPYFAAGLAFGLAKLQSRAAWFSAMSVVGLLCVFNGLLIVAYVLTMSRYECVTYGEMAEAVAMAIHKALGALL